MKLVPKPQHLLAGMVLLAVAGVYAYMAALDDRVSAAQTSIAAAALKEDDPDLFRYDPVYGPSGLWRVHTPVFQGLLKMALVPTGHRDAILPFRFMVPVVTLLFLGGMYALLYRECRSWSVAVFVAAVSTRVSYTLGGATWGVGSLGSITPAGLYLAVAPLLVLAMLRHMRGTQGRPRPARLFLLFGLVGLGGNLDLTTAMNLTLVLLIVYLGCNRFALSAWPIALGCALSALIGAMPYALYYLVLRVTMATAGAHVEAEAIHRAFEIAELAVLYPDVLKSMLNWLAWAGLFAIIAAAVLSRLERLRMRDLGFWIWFAAGVLFVATVLHGLSQAVGRFTMGIPPVLGFIDASRLVMLPIYVLVAQGLTNITRLIRWHPRLLRWVFAAMAVAWMISSDNVRVARHAAWEVATVLMDEEDKPRPVRRHRRLRERSAELAAIGRWAQEHTDKNAIFVTDKEEFRVLGRRSIVVSREDAMTLYYLAPWQLAQMMSRVEQQGRLLRPGDDRFEADSLKFIQDLDARKEYQGVGEWYVILPRRVSSEKSDPLVLIPASPEEAWGRHNRVYRLKLPSRARAEDLGALTGRVERR